MSFLEVATAQRELPLGQGEPQDTLGQRFAAYDAEHPEIYIAIRNRALKHWQDDATYISMKGIFEELRGTMGSVKLNNSFTSFYTDKLLHYCPFFAPYFHRRARAKGKMKLVYTR